MHKNNRCIYMAHVCFMSVVVTCGNVCCVVAIVEDSGLSSLRVLKYVVFSVYIVAGTNQQYYILVCHETLYLRQLSGLWPQTLYGEVVSAGYSLSRCLL